MSCNGPGASTCSESAPGIYLATRLISENHELLQVCATFKATDAERDRPSSVTQRCLSRRMELSLVAGNHASGTHRRGAACQCCDVARSRGSGPWSRASGRHTTRDRGGFVRARPDELKMGKAGMAMPRPASDGVGARVAASSAPAFYLPPYRYVWRATDHKAWLIHRILTGSDRAPHSP